MTEPARSRPALAALAVDLVAAGWSASVRLDDAQRTALVGLAPDAAALGRVAEDGVVREMSEVAGSPTIVRPLEVSRERLSEHVWRVTYDDGSVEEWVSWSGCYRPVARAKRSGRLDKRVQVGKIGGAE